MNRAQIKLLNKKIDKILSLKKLPVFPIYGGASGGGTYRDITQEETKILGQKKIPVPIKVNPMQGQEFLELLKI